MIIVLQFDNLKIHLPNLRYTFELLKQEKDGLLVNEKAPKCSLIVQITKRDKITVTHFLETKEIEENDLEEHLTELIVTFLNYKKIILKRLTVKNTEGKRLKPEIEIYCKNVPYMEIEDELYLDRSISKENANKDEYLMHINQTFVSDSDILQSLLKNSILGFKNKNSYKICNYESKLIIYKVGDYGSRYITIFGIDSLRQFHMFLINESKISFFTKSIAEVFLFDFDATRDENFYEALMKFESKHNESNEDYLFKIVELAPIFHKEKDIVYLRKIIDVISHKKYLERKTNFIKNKIYEIIKEKTVDRFCIGSLKHYKFYK
ncbi:hypothetical protein H312_00144 [Anncaliia algerae PRA339]|uniref:Uncharacterized protein n=1 Tax=Anncaliia algerae PRA339 TaxID=1288291 RepID=A0A059F682_9MICR|nr:hypothetical protein H312_00144 [Anncaliia algerae PRA339]